MDTNDDAKRMQREIARRLGPHDPRVRCHEEVAARYPVRITPYYLDLVDPEDPNDPIARMALPDARELEPTPNLIEDPLEEERHSPVPRLVHRYPDRAMLIMTTRCALYCRFCTRKRLVGRGEGCLSREALERVTDYLRAHPEVRDVLVSGGDPLTCTDEELDRVLGALRTVPSLDILRVHTRIPAVLPARVTDSLARTLARHAPVFVNTHFDHPRELTEEARAACARLADHGIPLGNQTVLLAGVNDSPETLAELFRGLLRARVRPYYLHQCDLTEGTEHLRTPLSRGVEVMEYLRGRVSGMAIPTFVVDAPHASGKLPVGPNYVVSQAPGRTVLRNGSGQMVTYPDPGAGGEKAGPGRGGVSGLLRGDVTVLRPEP